MFEQKQAFMKRSLKSLGLAVAVAAAAACTVHPKGEPELRQAAREAGHPYTRPFEKREIALLPANPSAEEVVRVALLSNGDVEAKYWQWRAAIEQIPIEGTQKAGTELSFETMLMNANSTWENTTLAIGNDAMNSLMLPTKLGTMATMALHDAQMKAAEFDKARYELRGKVLAQWYDYALTAELLRLESANLQLLELTSKVTESRLATGTASQVELLKSSNELAMAQNDIAMRKAKLDEQRAMLNGMLGRAGDAELNAPAALPPVNPPAAEDAVLLQQVAARNPALAALAHESLANREAITKAKLDYLPEFNIKLSGDLAGVTQTLMGSVVVPYLRYEALNAGIEQARANLHATQAMQRQTTTELHARVLADLVMLRDAQRQVALFDSTLLPRARQIVTATQNAYASPQKAGGGGGAGMGGGMGGRGAAAGGLLGVLDAQRSLIALQRLRAELYVDQLKQVADLEAIAASPLAARAADGTR